MSTVSRESFLTPTQLLPTLWQPFLGWWHSMLTVRQWRILMSCSINIHRNTTLNIPDSPIHMPKILNIQKKMEKKMLIFKTKIQKVLLVRASLSI